MDKLKLACRGIVCPNCRRQIKVHVHSTDQDDGSPLAWDSTCSQDENRADECKLTNQQYRQVNDIISRSFHKAFNKQHLYKDMGLNKEAIKNLIDMPDFEEK